MENKKFDLIILGSGPAGLQAAIYTARAGISTLVLGKKENSRLFRAHLISNYFGFPDGIDGAKLLEDGIKQALNLKAVIKEEEAIDISKDKENFLVKTSKNEYVGVSILLTTGIKNVSSGIAKERELTGRGISFCVACDGSYFKEKRVGVLGAGDFAAKEALELLEYTKDISIFTNGEEISISNDFRNKLEIAKINFITLKLKEFLGENKLEGVLGEDEKKINLDGMFIAKGVPKASDFAYKLGLSILNDFIVCDNKGKTNIPGIFAAGDVIGNNLQVASAVGSAVNTAFAIMSFLKTKENRQ